MNSLKLSSLSVNTRPPFCGYALNRSYGRSRRTFAAAFLVCCLTLSWSALGQITISDNFDSGMDTAWTHYAPLQTTPWNEQVSWTFTNDSGGLAYRIFGGPPNINRDPADGNNTGPARVGSFRNDSTYADFFTAVDIVKWDDTIPGNVGALAFRVNAPGFLTTFGYFAGYSSALDWRDQQGIFAFVEFQSELNVTAPNEVTGGAALVSRLNPTGKYRMVTSGTGGSLRGAIYNRTDLLEPIVKIGATNSDVPNGVSGLVVVSYDSHDDKSADFTFDNYYSSATPTSPVGLPGTPQVVELNPAPQTLFYTIPASNPITFAVQTFNTVQIATNTLKMFLNGADVTSQLVFSNRAGLLDPPNANFGVRYTGTLANNTIYNGQIIALDTGGQGTTNNFIFDTFSTNGTMIVEAEDYNFGNGQFIDNPPVSGLDPDGNPVNIGLGYYGQAGTREVDYFDTDPDTIPGPDEHQYRGGDWVGTAQNLFAGDTPRPDHLSTNVPDYGIWRMQAGEWLNYTRTFPATRWNVYLRTSSQARQDVRFDEVIGDRTVTNQTKALRGNFLVPNTASSTRFRYVPLTDAAGNPQVLDFAGVRTFRMTTLGGFDSDRQHGRDDNGSLQPNYFLFMPTTSLAPQTPWIAFAAPSANATDVSVQPTVQIIILNRATSVSLGTIQLRFDGVNVTSSATISGATTEGAGATVTYAPAGFLQPNSTHSISLVFSDGSTTQSNQWNFTAANLPLVPPGFSLLSPAGTNFSVQVHKAPNDYSGSSNPAADGAAFVNSTWRAERQLANRLIQPTTLQPYTNEAANTPTNYGFYVEPSAINYEQAGNTAGFFPGDQRFPGIPQNTNTYGDDPNNFAIAATIKLPVAAGVYRMGVRSDDGFKVTVGTNTPPNDLLLGIFDGSRSPGETTFDFVVANNGVYNFRIVYFEGSGGSEVEWYWVNRATGARELVRPLRLESAASVSGPYATETAAQIDPGAKTIILPKSGATRFYRLVSTTAYQLNSPTFSGNNVLLSYQ